MAKTPVKKKVDTSAWARTGTMLGALIVSVGSSHFVTSGHIEDNKAVMTATMNTHWKEERSRKDSAEVARDSISALKDDLHTRQNDSIILMLKELTGK